MSVIKDDRPAYNCGGIFFYIQNHTERSESMRIAVMGAGAVGGYYGGMLAHAGADVTLIARGRHLQAIQSDGLTVRRQKETIHIPDIKATASPEEAGPCDVVLFAVKSTVTEESAEQISPLIGPETMVISLQNGIDNEEKLAERLGAQHVVGGVAYISAAIERPGVIHHASLGSLTIGELDGEKSERVNRFAALASGAGIETRVTSDIVRTKWEKLLWNITFNPLSALTGAIVGDILDDPELRRTAEAILSEYVSVAKAKGLALREKAIQGVMSSSDSVRSHKTSMLQDREAGKAMEIEAIGGAIVRMGRQLGVPTPALQSVYASLRYVMEKEQH
jgi:2-dehydropantoate 2-reductase